jgi:hypothetical protein
MPSPSVSAGGFQVDGLRATEMTQVVISESLPPAELFVEINFSTAPENIAVDIKCGLAFRGVGYPSSLQWRVPDVSFLPWGKRTLPIALRSRGKTSVVSPFLMHSEVSSTGIRNDTQRLPPLLWGTASCNVSIEVTIEVPDGAGTRPRFFMIQRLVNIPTLYVRASWAFLTDAIVERTDGRLRSAWSAEVFPASPIGGLGMEWPSVGAPAARYVSASLSAFRSAGALDARATPIFALTLTKPTNVTLLFSDATGMERKISLGGIEVYLAGVKCQVSWVSDEHAAVRILTPGIESICSSAAANQADGCSMDAPLMVRIPSLIDAATLQTMLTSNTSLWPLVAKQAVETFGLVQQQSPQNNGSPAARRILSVEPVVSVSLLGSQVACPPFCPSIVGHHAPPLLQWAPEAAVDVLFSTRSSMALSDARQALEMPDIISPFLTQSPFSVASPCLGDNFIDPSSGLCTDIAYLEQLGPENRTCAFGFGNDCIPCVSPNMGLCPGGRTVLARPGYYTPSTKDMGSLVACRGPLNRCLGFNSTTGLYQCGEGYSNGVFACDGCALGFYPDGDGACARCPNLATDSVRSKSFITALVAFFSGFIGLLVLLFCITYFVTRAKGGTLQSTLRITLQFWTSTLLASLVLTSACIPLQDQPGMPKPLRFVVKTLMYLHMQGISIHPSCMHLAPFFASKAVDSLAIILFGLTTVGVLVAHASGSASKPITASCGLLRKINGFFDRLHFFPPAAFVVGMVVLYGITARMTADTLSCISKPMTVQNYFGLMGDGTTLRKVGITCGFGSAPCLPDVLARVVFVSVSYSSKLIVCWEKSHAPAGVLAAVTMALVLVAFPVTTLFIGCRIARQLPSSRLPRNGACRKHLDAMEAYIPFYRVRILKVTKVTNVVQAGDDVLSLLPTPRSQDHIEEDDLDALEHRITIPEAKAMGYFFHSDFSPRWFMSRNIDMAVHFSLAILSAWRNKLGPVTVLVLGLVPLLFQLFWYTYVRPYRRAMVWNNVARACGILVALLVWGCRYRLFVIPPAAASTDAVLSNLSYLTATLALVLLVIIFGAYFDSMFRTMALEKLRALQRAASTLRRPPLGLLSRPKTRKLDEVQNLNLFADPNLNEDHGRNNNLDNRASQYLIGRVDDRVTMKASLVRSKSYGGAHIRVPR